MTTEQLHHPTSSGSPNEQPTPGSQGPARPTPPTWYDAAPRGAAPAGPPTAGPPTAGPPTAGPPTAGSPTVGPPTAELGAPPAYPGQSSAPPTPPFPPTPNGPGPAHSPAPGPRAPRSERRGRLLELSTVAVLAAVLASGGTYAATRLGPLDTTPASSTVTSSTTPGRSTGVVPVVQADPNNPNWTATAAAVTPSVVSITAQVNGGVAEGSGVVFDTSGHILTNNHVVAGARSLTVTLADGHTYAATVKGTDPSTDLAVVTITNPPSSLTPITLGDSSTLKVGDPVMAVGNPLGLAGTVTTGIVSALNRPVQTQAAQDQQSQSPFGQSPFGQQSQSPSEPVVTNAIQTSAAINPGNSGGALVNGAGQLVGINSSIASLSSSGSQAGNIGIGFAIPINEAKDIADQLIASGTAEHAYLGVTPVDGTAQLGSSTTSGAQLQAVGEATPAAAAGLKVGDVITAVDGQRVDSADSLVGAIRAAHKGQVVTLTVIRDGAQLELKATLATRPATQN